MNGSSNPSFRNPYQRALVVLAGLTGLFLLSGLLALGLAAQNPEGQLEALAPISLGLAAFFGLSWLISWFWGKVQVRRSKSFLASNRPLVRWVYTYEEWREIKEIVWQDEQNDWRIQLGCLTFLFGLVGLLVGMALRAEEGFTEAVASGLVGAVWGIMAGGAIGAMVAGGNYLAARLEYLQPGPDQVALAPNEIYANGDYFRGDGYSSYIRRVELHPGSPTVLHIEMRVPYRRRTSNVEEWFVAVPGRVVEAVETTIPSLAATEPVTDEQSDQYESGGFE
jgi:hypothetical protein